jgi:hypothetical protein
MSTKTTITPNMVLKATEKKLRPEVVQDTFWAPLTKEDGFDNVYGEKAPSNIMEKKTISSGAKYIEFGQLRKLNGEGRLNGATLLGYEEKLLNYETKVYFSDVRHGVPFDLKGVDAWTTKDFIDMEDGQRELAVWQKRHFEVAAWQGYFHGVDDKTNAKHGSAAVQSWHPNIYSFESAGLAQATWSATNATYMTNISSLINALATGDIVSIDRIYEAEKLCANLNINPIRVSYGSSSGGEKEDECWLWVYPREARIRIKKALQDVFMYADVRGPNNRAIRGDIMKFGKFMFVEAGYIPYLNRVDANTVALQEAWAVDATTGKRTDQRTATKGLAHGIFGADALCLAEPGPLTYDFEETDYKYKKGIGSYRMYGFKRREYYDDYTTVTQVSNQASLIILENNG